MDERPAVAVAEDGLHDPKTAVRTREQELILSLQQVEAAGNDA